MGTKNNPAPFDCYPNADPDEPMFTLLGRDPAASFVVMLWADIRRRMGQAPDDPQLLEATACAADMECWANKVGKGAQVIKAMTAMLETLHEGKASIDAALAAMRSKLGKPQ